MGRQSAVRIPRNRFGEFVIRASYSNKRRKGAARFFQDQDSVLLDLIKKDQISWIEAKGLCDEMLVLGDMFDRITAVNAQIERFEGGGLTPPLRVRKPCRIHPSFAMSEISK